MPFASFRALNSKFSNCTHLLLQTQGMARAPKKSFSDAIARALALYLIPATRLVLHLVDAKPQRIRKQSGLTRTIAARQKKPLPR
jgi:hypothetical protein